MSRVEREENCPVATFVRNQIGKIDKSQKEIAEEVGFEKQNVITMIKQGKTKLPLAKIGLMAKALDTDPLWLLKLCLSTYQKDSWEALKPIFDEVVTEEERTLLHAWRNYVGVPNIEAISEPSRILFYQFLDSIREATPSIQEASL